MAEKPSTDTILEKALEMGDPQERLAYLDKVCGGDENLRKEVASLLAAHFAADAFMATLDDPSWQAAMKEAESGFGAGKEVPTISELAADFPELEIIEMIGRGGMGAVFKARQESLDRFVALKVLPGDWNAKVGFQERFAREAKTLAALNHPGIVTIHEFGERNGRFFFTMEYVDGTDLARMIQSGEVVPDLALNLISQICDAIQFAHDRKVVHRDIKPGNILVDRSGRVKVADFGIAKLGRAEETEIESGTSTDRPADLTAPNGVIGTPRYMAPEQAAPSSEVDHRADLYALGVVFYEMLVGSLPAEGGLAIPPSRGGKVDRRWDRVVMRALEQDPTRRYQNATQIKTAVEAVLAEQKRWFPRWLKAVAALAVVATGVLFLWPKPDPNGPLVNSLGMKFVAVPGVEGLVSVWETRVKDYEVFAQETGRMWQRPSFEQTAEHPVVQVSWHDARAFCQWLTERERKDGRLKEGEVYRLPTDREWSAMAHLTGEDGSDPQERNLKQVTVYPWGEGALIPDGAGNYPDLTAQELYASAAVSGYHDGFAATAPVGGFRPTKEGLFDLGGNVWEWTASPFSSDDARPVLRGGGWWAREADDGWKSLLASKRRADVEATGTDEWDVGFRVLRGPESSEEEGDDLFRQILKGDLDGVKKAIAAGIDMKAASRTGQPPIVLAAEIGNLEMVKLLQKEGWKLEGSDRRGRTALHAAAEGGHTELVRWLLEQKVNPRPRTIAGQEPLFLAVPRAPIELLDLLLTAGGPDSLVQADTYGTRLLDQACVFSPDETLRWIIEHLSAQQIRGGGMEKLSASLMMMMERDTALLADFLAKAEGRWTSESLMPAMLAAINYDKESSFSLLLDLAGDKALNEKTVADLGWNAVVMGRPWAIKAMLARAWEIKKEDSRKTGPLIHMAMLTGRDIRQMLRLLMGDMLDERIVTLLERTQAKIPPPATRETIRILAEAGVEIEARDDSKRTPLIAAAMKGNLIAVETLLELGAEIEAKDELDFTPLLCAVENGSLEIVKELDRRGADFEAVSKNGEGVLYHVHRNVAMLQYLLGKGLPVDTKSEHGATPLIILSKEGDEEIVSILLEAGADVHATGGAGQYAGNTALHMASGGVGKNAQEALDTDAALGGPSLLIYPSAEPDERARTVKLLIEAGADPNALNKNFYSPLHFAAMNGQWECVKVLLENGAVIYSPVWDTPLATAALNSEDPKVLALLLENKAPLDRRDAYGAYPIHRAAYNGQAKMVKMLLDAGADPDVRDFTYRTPLHQAATADRREVVDLLWKRGARMNAADVGNVTPAQLASQMGHGALAVHLEDLSEKTVSRPAAPKTEPNSNNEK